MTVCLSVLLFLLLGYGQPPNKQGLFSFCHIKSLTTFPEGNIKTFLHPFHYQNASSFPAGLLTLLSLACSVTSRQSAGLGVP